MQAKTNSSYDLKGPIKSDSLVFTCFISIDIGFLSVHKFSNKSHTQYHDSERVCVRG